MRTNSKAGSHHKKISKALVVVISASIAIVTTLTICAFWSASISNSRVYVQPTERRAPIVASETHTNCSDIEGVKASVSHLANANGYLHQFEFQRLHPCCIRRKPKPIVQSDVVFIISSKAQTKNIKETLPSWTVGIDNVLVTRYFDKKDSSDIPSDPESSQLLQIWALKYLHGETSNISMALKQKKWFFLADEDTWINVPSLLALLSNYDPHCPVSIGYVWSHVWTEDVDYMSGPAGVVLSSEAFLRLTPAFDTETCPFSYFSDIAFGKCCWKQGVQIIHSRGFYFDPPDRSKDRHEVVWLPPLAEAITYHYVTPRDMAAMTDYVNSRWLFDTSPNANLTYLLVSRRQVVTTLIVPMKM